MDISSFQQVDAVEVVDVAPLNYSGNIGGNAQFDIDTWNWCITSQFPISRVEKDNNTVVLHIGSPHQSYTIRTRMKNNTLDGPAVILTPSNRVIAEFNYVNGEIEGKCKLYYESGSVFFVGHLEIGLRHYIRSISERYRREQGRQMETLIPFTRNHKGIGINHIFVHIDTLLPVVPCKSYENQGNHIRFGMDAEIYFPGSDIIIQVFLYCIFYLLV